MSNTVSKNKARMYLDVIKTNAGVCYLQGKPGIGKTATLEQLAQEEGLAYFDIRLSMCAEEDFNIPMPNEQTGLVKNTIPEWAAFANEQPTLIVFEELNRASLAVRNAALQILLERRIGHKFKFNNNVYFCATGNFGEEDGTEVEDFDSALNNRLIHFRFSMSVPEWKEGFAKEHVHPLILDFVEAKPEHFYKEPSDGGAYATPRSWTHFSKLLESKIGMKSDIKQAKSITNMFGGAYVGPSAAAFMNYLENMELVSINDIIDDYPKVKKNLKQLNRDILSSLLNNLKEFNIDNFDSKQFKNVTDFLVNNLSEDEQVSYLLHVAQENDVKNKKSNSNKLMAKGGPFEHLKDKMIDLLQ